MSVNLTKRNKDYSVFLPSISTFYNNVISKYRKDGDSFISPDRVPAAFEHGVDGMDFLKTDGNTYYDYKWGLYSAGHAQLNLDKADVSDNMVQCRDRENTFILGDSGGFQIIKGVIQCDWPNFKSDDSLRRTILDWLEYTADYSMILDIPTMAASEPYKAKTGIQDFNQCLDYTLHNCNWFAKNRKYNTKYMNVLQGRNKHEADVWYDAVKHLPFEGWAFGGNTKLDANIMLSHLIKMRDDKLLERGERDLLHFLGTSKLDWGVIFTAVKRALRKHVNEDMEVMYDCASPFIATAMGQVYTQHVHRNDKFGYVMESAVDDKRLSGSNINFPWGSPVGERLTMGDLNWYKPGMLNKNGKEGKTSWDSFTYMLLMSHNVYQHIESVQRANALTDTARLCVDADWKHWQKTNTKNSKILQLDSFVPRNVLFMVDLIEKLFESETPMQMLEDAAPLIADFNGVKSLATSHSIFADLFDSDDSTSDNVEFSDEQAETAETMLESLTD
jgi:hypothetical protein